MCACYKRAFHSKNTWCVWYEKPHVHLRPQGEKDSFSFHCIRSSEKCVPWPASCDHERACCNTLIWGDRSEIDLDGRVGPEFPHSCVVKFSPLIKLWLLKALIILVSKKRMALKNERFVMLPQKHLPKQQDALHLAESKGKCTDVWTASLPLRSPGLILALWFGSSMTCCLSSGHGKVDSGSMATLSGLGIRTKHYRLEHSYHNTHEYFWGFFVVWKKLDMLENVLQESFLLKILSLHTNRALSIYFQPWPLSWQSQHVPHFLY